jgi:pimeloyl-ACP methyl ester carboxylesterase
MADDPNAAPEWFRRALSAPVESRYADVDGTPIHYLSWNAQDTHKPGLLFAHGFRAHARWWSFIAPFFLSRFRVVSMDFAGMGDSGNRAEYAPLSFTRDLIGVMEHAELGKATLVGHSFGGNQVLRTCAQHPEKISRAVVIDSYMRLSEQAQSQPLELRPKKIYPTLEAARARFRLVPPENRAAPYILDYVGQHSLKPVEGGWTWKFDEDLKPQASGLKMADVLARVELPVTFVYGDASAIVPRALAHDIVQRLRSGRGPIAIPQSHHHVLLDQPLSLVATLRALLY